MLNESQPQRFLGDGLLEDKLLQRLRYGGGPDHLVFPPVAAFLIAQLGWRGAFMCFGGIFLVILTPFILVFIRTKPADLGQLPDGDAPSISSADEVPEVPGLSVKEAAGTATFWLLLLLYVVQYLSQSGMSLHFVAFSEGMGWSRQLSANIFGAAIGVSIAGRLVFGWLADKQPPQHLMAVSNLMFAVAVLILEIGVIRIGVRSSAILIAFAVLYGAALGAMAVYPVLVVRCFGLRHFSKLLGIVMIGFYLGIIIGPYFAGERFDATGSYEAAFVTFAAMFVGCGILCLLVRSPLERRLAN